MARGKKNSDLGKRNAEKNQKQKASNQEAVTEALQVSCDVRKENTDLSERKPIHPFFLRQKRIEVEASSPCSEANNVHLHQPCTATQSTEEEAQSKQKKIHPFFQALAPKGSSFRSPVKAHDLSICPPSRDTPNKQEKIDLSDGKPTHPFFGRQKVLSSTFCPGVKAGDLEVLHPCPPLHVTQGSEECANLIWGLNWEFSTAVSKETGKEEFLQNKLQQLGCQPWRHLLGCYPENSFQPYKCPTTKSSPAPVSTGFSIPGHCDRSGATKALEPLLKYLQDTQARGRQHEHTQDDGNRLACMETLTDRLLKYKSRHDNFQSLQNAMGMPRVSEPETDALLSNALWTDVYQPKSSKEVCGNKSAVESLQCWLQNWYQKGVGNASMGEGGVTDNQDNDRGWFQSDSDDSDSHIIDDTDLPNTILVTGPAGCGKSAAIYACAGEHGFTVIEVNASDCRNGALIKAKFGEAMESHGLSKWTSNEIIVESLTPEQVNPIPEVHVNGKGSSVFHNSTKDKSTRSKRFSKRDTTGQATVLSKKKKVEDSPQRITAEKEATPEGIQTETLNKRMTVILFEDVDTVFEEDRGFMVALVQLAKSTKRPIILTSNKRGPALPQVLQKLKIEFGIPMLEDLVTHAYMVCIAEGTPYSPWLIECLIKSCNFDLRKTMMALQFWIQSHIPAEQMTGSLLVPNTTVENRTENSSCASTKKHFETDARRMYELDAQYCVLPNLLPLSFPCRLSLYVAEKISDAVLEFNKHGLQVAVKAAEEEFSARQAEAEYREKIRRELKKAKDAKRIEVQAKENSITHDDLRNIDSEIKNGSASPVKNVREAKALARSPLKPKKLKQRRIMQLCLSDEEGPATEIAEMRDKITDPDHAAASGATHDLLNEENLVDEVQGRNDIVTTDCLDAVVTETSGHKRPKGFLRLKRIKKEPQGKDLSNPSNAILEGAQSDDYAVNGEILSVLCAGSFSHENSKAQCLDSNGQLLHNDIVVSDWKSDENLMSKEMTEQCSDKHRQEICSSMGGTGHNFANITVQVSNNEIACKEPLLVQSGFLEGSRNKLENDDSMVALASINKSWNLSLENVETMVSTDSQNGAALAFADSTGHTQSAVDSSSMVSFDPVQQVWTEMRVSRNELVYLKDPGYMSSYDATCIVAEFLDVLSASDLISGLCIQPSNDGKREPRRIASGIAGAELGHDGWDTVQEFASQFVHAGLEYCLDLLPGGLDPEGRLTSLSNRLIATNDAATVVKCMTIYRPSDCPSWLELDSGFSCLELNRTRQERYGLLADAAQATVFPHGRIQHSSFVDYTVYMTRIQQLTLLRKASACTKRGRSSRAQLSTSEIEKTDMELLKSPYGKLKF